jgi:hypothetical protein
MILDVIVGPAWEKFRDLRPPIPQLLVSFYDEHIFLLSPLVLFDIWIQVIVPPAIKLSSLKVWLPFSALLTDSSGKCSGNLAPILWTIFINHFYQSLVLFIRPRSLYHSRIKYFLPPVQTLDVSATLEEGGDTFPVFCLK